MTCYWSATRSKSVIVEGLIYKGKPVSLDLVTGYLRISTGELHHRALMQETARCKLGKNEHVHHLNGNKSDNRIENLRVVDWSDHARITSTDAALKRRKEKAELTEYRRRFGPIGAATEGK